MARSANVFLRSPFSSLWRYLTERFEMSFLGGFVGISQDPATGTVSPQLGWAVRER